mmetsp:Transcript_40905/g.81336  ORF Transcript_40905/g.81336 Transcript_40905/m.81336 type:complete len:120 (+) Transcript_40905:115-474(+)|eukprot:CAMPEP_0170395284 /NCGR_PEP_ID=MMETSP0117_2-20130122/21694_1 /TAXON_ID=400756 /ORGANISM="Durinskia baltica, Strain CSIRO CS-38" /LENGTH=119 /DNA_ID=CAMNT_0010651579 /DNA_START=113 /DNA_END=472 /DNA_ORIENTATION=-
MAPRVARHIAMDLIKFAKKLEVKAYAYDLTHKSTYEFARQLSSPKLGKVNPDFSVEFEWLQKAGPSVICAEFINGSKWEVCGEGKTAADLRYEFFEQAVAIEELLEEEEEAAKPAAKKK